MVFIFGVCSMVFLVIEVEKLGKELLRENDDEVSVWFNEI